MDVITVRQQRHGYVAYIIAIRPPSTCALALNNLLRAIIIAGIKTTHQSATSLNSL